MSHTQLATIFITQSTFHWKFFNRRHLQFFVRVVIFCSGDYQSIFGFPKVNFNLLFHNRIIIEICVNIVVCWIELKWIIQLFISGLHWGCTMLEGREKRKNKKIRERIVSEIGAYISLVLAPIIWNYTHSKAPHTLEKKHTHRDTQTHTRTCTRTQILYTQCMSSQNIS